MCEVNEGQDEEQQDENLEEQNEQKDDQNLKADADQESESWQPSSGSQVVIRRNLCF